MKPSSLQDTTYWLLSQFAVRTRHDTARMAEKKFGLTWPQMFTLCILQPDTAVAMNTISGQMLCDASNVTGIVDRLSNHGYIVRRPGDKDRRITMIALTQKGAALRQEILQHMVATEPDGLKRLDTSERAQLQRLLTKVLD